MQKRIAAIHDLSCFGKCSLTIALPVISCFGIECAVVPTAMLSGHFAALPEVSVVDLTENMGVIANQWERGGVTFDGIFSGYLGTAAQVAQAVTDTKLEELTREVREHNNFAKRMPVVEHELKVLSHRITVLEGRKV